MRNYFVLLAVLLGPVLCEAQRVEPQSREPESRQKAPSAAERRNRPGPWDNDVLVFKVETNGTVGDEGARPRIVRTKEFQVKPMFSDEAVEQMELLGHDFFVFRDAESSQINVLYRREDGNYGLIVPGDFEE